MIKHGSKVSFHYTLMVEGQVVDSSFGEDPLLYEQGLGQVIPGLEEALEGLKVGDKKAFVVAAEKGYGLHNPEAVEKIPRQAFKDSDLLKVGEIVTGEVGDQPFQATVLDLNEEEVTLDLNHPLAGKELHFEVEIQTVE